MDLGQNVIFVGEQMQNTQGQHHVRGFVCLFGQMIVQEGINPRALKVHIRHFGLLGLDTGNLNHARRNVNGRYLLDFGSVIQGGATRAASNFQDTAGGSQKGSGHVELGLIRGWIRDGLLGVSIGKGVPDFPRLLFGWSQKIGACFAGGRKGHVI